MNNSLINRKMKALSNENRRKVLEHIKMKEIITTNEVSRLLFTQQPAASNCMKILREAGFIYSTQSDFSGRVIEHRLAKNSGLVFNNEKLTGVNFSHE